MIGAGPVAGACLLPFVCGLPALLLVGISPVVAVFLARSFAPKVGPVQVVKPIAVWGGEPGAVGEAELVEVGAVPVSRQLQSVEIGAAMSRSPRR